MDLVYDVSLIHLTSWQQIEVLIRQYLSDIEVCAYGSRINGRSHDGSDLDLVLRSPDLTVIDSTKLYAFKENLQESTIPFLIEARDWAVLPESFHREIERNHIVFSQ